MLKRLLPGALFLAAACSKSSTPYNNNDYPSPGDAQVSMTIDPTQPGAQVPADFEGLSFEAGSLTNTGYFTTGNTAFIAFIKGLGPGVIRIGGNSVDKTHWTDGPRSAATGTDSIATDDVDRFFAFAGATGWKVMWALNLGSGTPTAAASEAKYVYSGYAGHLLWFEIGNEPDLYSHNGLRATTYTFHDFEQEFTTFYDTVKALVPGAVFSGPAAASNTSTWVVPFAGDEYAKVRCLTEHYYKMGPPTNPDVRITALLNGNAAIVAQADAMAAAAGAHNIPYRISECNSVYDGGKAGVSNTLASALWGLDYMFALAEQGAAGVNFHGGGAGAYTPISYSNGQFSAMPLYYGMLFFAQASSGRLLTVSPALSDSLNLTAHGVLQNDGTILGTLINKDLSREAYVTLSTGRQIRSASIVRLVGPAADSTSGVMLGGATVNANGTWAAQQTENAVISGNTCRVKVPPYSAALVTIR